MKSLIYILLFLISTLSFAQNITLFEQGNALYNDGKFTEAIKKYESILDNEKHSAELYFNLANANYKLNNIAPSIYYYEKALQLSPKDKDIQNNLVFAKNMTIDAIDIIPEVGFSKLFKNATNTMSYDRWALTSVALMLGFVILFLIYYFTYATAKKRIAFIGSIASLVLTLIALAFAFHKYNLVQIDKPAIVFAQESQVKNEPNLRSEIAFKLHEGTKVQVLDTVSSWKQIKLTDGKIGWVPNEDIKLLGNF
jgi:tetratricopeptide (TPR) repeat protein